MNPRIIYYYQTFEDGLYNLFTNNTSVTHIHLASIHFGVNEDNTPYIHLNDNNPNDKIFDHVWEDLGITKTYGIKNILMLGGAGGAYTQLFSQYSTYYKLLKDLITSKRDCIDGIDLDIEESVDINNVIKLIFNIKRDFGNDFIITMAPIQSSLESDTIGLGGFCYKDLYNKVGNLIEYFNTQFYTDYSVDAYDKIIKNNYPPEKVVMGSISSQDFNTMISTAKLLSTKYNNFGGVYNWEYFDSPPSKNNPALWSICMANSMRRAT